jgi:hypothetical protein
MTGIAYLANAAFEYKAGFHLSLAQKSLRRTKLPNQLL